MGAYYGEFVQARPDAATDRGVPRRDRARCSTPERISGTARCKLGNCANSPPASGSVQRSPSCSSARVKVRACSSAQAGGEVCTAIRESSQLRGVQPDEGAVDNSVDRRNGRAATSSGRPRSQPCTHWPVSQRQTAEAAIERKAQTRRATPKRCSYRPA